MIYGERVRLRADERGDIPTFVRWMNDPEVTRHLSAFLPLSQAAEENWFEGMLKLPQAERPLAIEIRESDAWRLVGNCSFMDIDWRTRSAEVGILIGEKSC